MKIEYSIESQSHHVLITIEGTIVITDLFDIITTYQLDENYHTGMNIIYDFRIGSIDLSSTDMMNLVDFLENRKPEEKYKLAMVLPKDNIYGQGKMFDAYSDELKSTLRLFRDMPSCLEWINAIE